MRNFLFVFNSRIAKHGSFEDFMIELGRQIGEMGGRAGFVFPAIIDESVAGKIRAVGEVFITGGDWRGKDGIDGILRVVETFGADVVNTHFCDFNSFFHFYKRLRGKGVRGVYHYHGEILPLNEMAWWKRFVSSIRYFSWYADLIVTVSKANRRFLEFLNVMPPIKVVYNGIDLERFDGDSVDCGLLARYGIGKDEDYICYLGSLNEERKRVALLLEIFKLIRDKSNVKLLVMGKGDVDRFKKIADSLGVGDSVVFTGLMKDYPYGLIKGAKVFVSASKQESFGLVFAEAFLLGAPVVACRVGGIPEVVIDGNSGFLLEKDDKAGFANAVLKLLNDDRLRKDMADWGADFVKSNFALKDRVKELLEILNN